MAGELERHRIGMAAQDRGILAGELARRLGQAHARRAVLPATSGFSGRIGDIELRHMRHRPHAAGDGALERLLRCFDLAGGL